MANSRQTDIDYNYQTCTDPGEEIVISGIAGRFPGSNSVKEFAENLYNKKLLTTVNHTRHNTRQQNLPPALGVVNNLEKFDSIFFGVSSKQANLMDPAGRTLLEHAFEAVLDAGLNPTSLRGGNTGVFIGCCFSEVEDYFQNEEDTGLGLVGCCRSVFANRISFFLDVNGPSLSVDTACSSTSSALDIAYQAIRNGECDSAVVGGCNLCFNPSVTRMFYNLGVLTMGDACRCFDDAASGYVRSDTVAVIMLQKAKDAKRVYASIVHVKSNNDGYKSRGITFSSAVSQTQLLRETYEECGLPPSEISYVEAHATAARADDSQEVEALDQFFSPGRALPLKIGSVKSNAGHSEGGSGLCTIAKVIIMMENNLIPPTINYNKPQKGLKALEEGRLRVVTEPTPWNGGYVGINCNGVGGTNVHLILKPNPKRKRNLSENNKLPIIVCASGRTHEAVESFLNDVENRPVDTEYIRLLHDIFDSNISGHLYRGYTVTNLTSDGGSIKTIQRYEGVVPPVWFVFSGMGSQWPGMGTSLMRFSAFARAIQKCDSALKPRGVDVMDILTNPDKGNFDNILRSFVGITAVQIGLVDLLKDVGIFPDKMIGHSLGELGCAYADGSLTAEETILASYSRGLASIETELIHGSMAAVGLGYNQVKDLCPSDVEVGCHNGPDSSTITGPAESMKAFIAQLQAKGIFVKEVPCGNIAYHSRYIAPAGERLLSYLRDVIKDPKPRSEKWLSTSVPRAQWSAPTWKLSSAEYHTNNLLSSVLFEETAALIPKDAITIEIAPHGLLQAILKRSLASTVVNIALTKRGHNDNTEMFVEALGRLYNVGLQPQLAKLYPDIEFPVSRGTPMISHLIKWEHSEDWIVPISDKHAYGTAVKPYNISLSNDLGKSMVGHVVDGRHLVPVTAYLQFVWELYCEQQKEKDLSVVFENVIFNRTSIIPQNGNIQLVVTIQEGAEIFHISDSNEAIVTGTIRILENAHLEEVPPEYLTEINEPEEMNTKDIYKELKLRGYQYSGMFRGIRSSSITGSKGHVAWNNNWISFLDSILQLQILRDNSRLLMVPTGIKKLVINLSKHEEALKACSAADASLPVVSYSDLQTVVCGGVTIRGISVSAIHRRAPSGIPVLEEYKFVPHRDLDEIGLFEALSLFVNVALENIHSIDVQTVELIDDEDNLQAADLVSPLIIEILANIPLIRSAPLLITSPNRFVETSLPESVTIIGKEKIPENTSAMVAFGHDLLSKKRVENLKQLIQLVQQGGFVVSLESGEYSNQYLQNFDLNIVMEKRVSQKTMLLLKKKTKLPQKTVMIRLSNNEFSWVEDVKKTLSVQEQNDSLDNLRLLLVGEGFENGLLGFVNCLRRELGGKIVTGVLIQDTNAPEFSLDSPFYRDQLDLNLALNVLQRNVWGTYRHLPLPPMTHKSVSNVVIKQKTRGDLRSFSWEENVLNGPTSMENVIHVFYAALNFRDVLLATNKLSKLPFGSDVDVPIGFEFSGVNAAGNRVMGLSTGSSFANYCQADKNFLFAVPDQWMLEEAATIPFVYGTCYYAFYVIGKIKKGDKILIHAGSGGVGQAAINLALHEGCEVFTTVGTPEERTFIKETFPSIDDDHIGNSRDTSFEMMVLRQTKGQGVDIVLNSLSDDKLQASLRCLACNGQFLEIGKFDIMSDGIIRMGIFSKRISFRPVMFDSLIQSASKETEYVACLVRCGIQKGVVKPLVRTVFEEDRVEAAFRYMAAGKHIGKVLIKIRNEKDRLDMPVVAHPRYHCKKGGSYVIFGGLGGFGLELTDWLIGRGAENLILVSRNGVKNGYQRSRIVVWESRRIKVPVIVGKDVSNRKDVESILRFAEERGPIDGIFNLAVSLMDARFPNQTRKSFEESFKGKARLTKILDKLTRKMCPYLRHFVVFSSVSCGRGIAGQTNYGMSNSVMERICERRVQDGLPALAVQWGVVGDVGLVADMQMDGKELVIDGILQQTITSCLEELDGFLQRKNPVVSSMVVAKKTGRRGTRSIIETVQSILELNDLKQINKLTTLTDLGVDSMIAVEIKETLEREFSVFLTVQQIRVVNFAKLIEMSENTSEFQTRQNDIFLQNLKITNEDYLGKMVGNVEMYSKICVDIPTKAEADKNRVYLIPGLEGCSLAFKAIAEYIKAPATCLQIDLSIDKKYHESVVDTAKAYLPYVLSANEGKRDFTFVGYSFGAVIAIELARSIEARGMSAQLILIDGAPNQLKLLNATILNENEAESQNKFLSLVLHNLASVPTVGIQRALQHCATWDERVQKLINYSEYIDLSIDFSEEVNRKLIDSMFGRMISLRRYDISEEKPIKSSIILLKAAQSVIDVHEEDYGLRKITEGTVTVHVLEGNHLTILENINIARVVNGETLPGSTVEIQ